MRSLITKQAERFLRERKNYKRWLAVFTCLAAMVVLGTVMVLRYTGTAMTGNPQCGQEEHSHMEECFSEVLVCGQEASAEHEHMPECYEKQLICQNEEHVHIDACYAQNEDATAPEADDTEPWADDKVQPTEVAGEQDQVEASAEQEAEPGDGRHILAMQGEDYMVTVSYGDEAGIPENAELLVKEILADSAEYEAYYQEMLAAMAQETAAAGEAAAEEDVEVSFARFFDITFLADGVKVEPAAPVDIKISYPDTIQLGENEAASVVHFAEEGTEVLDAEVVEKEEGSDFEFTQESFSVTSTVISKAPGKGGSLTASGNGYKVTVTYGKNSGITKNDRLVVEEVKDNGENENNSYRKYLNNSQGAIKEKTKHNAEEVKSSFARVFQISIENGSGQRVSVSDVDVQIQYTAPVKAETAVVAAMVLNTEDSGEVLGMETLAAGQSVTTFSGRQSFSTDAPNVATTMLADVSALADGEGSGTPEDWTDLDKDGTIDGVNGSEKNDWQIVAGKYEGNSNKTVYSDGDRMVRVQKNVIPTDVENEFYVYLSVDIKTLIRNVFKPEHFKALTHVDNVEDGAITNWSKEIEVAFENIPNNWSKGTYIVKSPYGEIVYEGEIGWNQANNVVLIYVVEDTPGNKIAYQMGGMNKGDRNKEITLSTSAWNAIKKEFKTSVALNEVNDQMGAYIIFEGCQYVDGVVSPSEVQTIPGGTIKWTPKAKETECQTENSIGSDGKVEGIWFKNVAELLYKVKLDVTKPGFESCGAEGVEDMITNAPKYPVNQDATLKYQIKDEEGKLGDVKEVHFPIPEVRGLLYDIPLKKTDLDETTKLLPGAEFILKDADGKQVGDKITTADGDLKGTATFAGLPWGTYTIWEMKAPEGYQSVGKDGKSVGQVTVCYTEERSKLLPGEDGQVDFSSMTLRPESAGHMVYYSSITQKEAGEEERVPVTITNEKIPPILLEKKWEGDEDTPELRPDEVTFIVSGIDKSTGEQKEVEVTFGKNDENQWRKQCDDIFEAETYTVTEKADGTLKNYTASGCVETTETGTTGKTVRVYTITNTMVEQQVLILKKSMESGDEASYLNGAEFSLYDTDPGEEGAEPVEPMEGKKNLVSTKVEEQDGVIYTDTLPAGTYWLVETKEPDGYDKLKKPVKITVDADGIKVLDPNWPNATEQVIEVEDGKYTISILNSAGYELPETGGPGTIMYTFGGLAIIAAGLVYALSMKRKQERGYH